MNWDQIEHNWQAMTRRIRPERRTGGVPIIEESRRSGDMAEIAVDWPERTAALAVSAARLIV